MYKCLVIYLGCNQLIVWLTSATRPDLEFKNPTFWGQKNDTLTTADMQLKGRIHFFFSCKSFQLSIFR